MQLKTALIFSLSCLFTSQIWAVPAEDAAAELSKTMFPKAQHTQMIDAITQAGLGLIAQKAQGDGKSPDMEKEQKKLRGKIEKEFSYKYFIDLNVAKMKSLFSDEELKTILAFHRTAIGKKWVEKTPEIVGEGMKSVRNKVDEKLPKMVGMNSEVK